MEASEKFEKLGKQFMSLVESKRDDIRWTIFLVCKRSEVLFLKEETFHDQFFIKSPNRRVKALAALQYIFEHYGVKVQDREPFDGKTTPYSNLTLLISLLGETEVKREEALGVPLCFLGCDYLNLPAEFCPLLIDLPCNEINKIFRQIKLSPLKVANHVPILRNIILFLTYGCSLIDDILVDWIVTREASQLIQNIVNAYTHTTSESEKLQIEAAMTGFLRALRNNKEWESQWKDFKPQWLENLADTTIQDHSLSRKELVSAIEAAIIKRHRDFLNPESRKQFGIEHNQNELEEISKNLMCSSIAWDKEQTETGENIDTFWRTSI